jgi:cation diffusion facilitator family transporter
VSILQLVKKGNLSSLTAALGNTFLAILKGIAASITGSGAMFATTMHSIADAINQGFVFIGSILAEKEPTRRFPAGFGRVVNLFVLISVIVISIMAYETILKGWKLFKHPEPASSIWLSIIVLLITILVDGYVLIKAMKEILHETRVEARGLGKIKAAFRNVHLASPPTRLVFYEDIIATLGAFLALFFIFLAQWTGFYSLDGVGAMLIGVLLIGVAIKIGYENTVGLIGVAAPRVVEERISTMILNDPDVVDIKALRILQEGKRYHVESYMELRKGLSLAEADDIKFHVRDKLLEDPDVSDVTMGILETDNIQSWTTEKLNENKH